MKNRQKRIAKGKILETAIRHGMRTRGFDVIHLLPDGQHPCYTYTVGLSTTYLHPEIVVTGFTSKKANEIIIAFAEEISSGRKLLPGMTVTDIFNYPITAVEVPPEWIRQNMRPVEIVNRRPFTALQLVVSGPDGKYPWDRVGHEDGYGQQLLGTLPPSGCVKAPQGNA